MPGARSGRQLAMAKQAPHVYFWDQADEELLYGGPIEKLEFVDSNGARYELSDKFDMDRIASVAWQAAQDIREATT